MLDDCLWLDPAWFNYWFSFHLARSVSILTHGHFSLGMSNHARLDTRRFGSGIRIHPKVRIVSHRIHGTMFAWHIKDHIVASQIKL